MFKHANGGVVGNYDTTLLLYDTKYSKIWLEYR